MRQPGKQSAEETSGALECQRARPATRGRWLVAAALLLCAGSLVVARLVVARDAERLLRDVRQAQRHVSLEGEATVGTLVRGQWLERRARIRKGEGRVLVSFLDGEPANPLLDDGERLWELDRDAETAIAIGPSPRQRDMDLLLTNYRAERGQARTVAGMQAMTLILRSVHDGHEARRIWVDPESRAVLGRETRDVDGRLVARTVFTAVTPGVAVPDLSGALPAEWRREVHPEDEAIPTDEMEFEEEHGFAVRSPSYLPPGYQREGVYVRRCERGRAYAELRYHDGLRTMSVFEYRPRRAGRGRGGAGGGGKGGQAGWGRGRGAGPELIDQGQMKSLRDRRDELVVVSTGDLTVEELKRVAAGIP